MPLAKHKSIVHYTSLHPQRAIFSVQNNLIFTNKENIFVSKVTNNNPISLSYHHSKNSIIQIIQSFILINLADLNQ